MNGNEFRAIGKGCLDLHLLSHFGDAFHYVVSLQNRGAVAHKISHAASVAGAFKNFISKDGNAFRVVELKTAPLPPSRQICGHNDHQFFLLAGAEMHREALDGKMLFDNLVGQLSDRTPRHHAASVENRKIIRELLAKIEILFNQKDCHGALTAEQVERGLDFVF